MTGDDVEQAWIELHRAAARLLDVATEAVEEGDETWKDLSYRVSRYGSGDLSGGMPTLRRWALGRTGMRLLANDIERHRER